MCEEVGVLSELEKRSAIASRGLEMDGNKRTSHTATQPQRKVVFSYIVPFMVCDVAEYPGR